MQLQTCFTTATKFRSNNNFTESSCCRMLSQWITTKNRDTPSAVKLWYDFCYCLKKSIFISQFRTTEIILHHILIKTQLTIYSEWAFFMGNSIFLKIGECAVLNPMCSTSNFDRWRYLWWWRLLFSRVAHWSNINPLSTWNYHDL